MTVLAARVANKWEVEEVVYHVSSWTFPNRQNDDQMLKVIPGHPRRLEPQSSITCYYQRETLKFL